MRAILKLVLQLARCSTGSALVEMTIIVPIAISLAAGGVDFGMAFSTQATGSKSVRDAARYLGSIPASSCTSEIAHAEHLAVYGQLVGGSPLIKGWDTIGTITATCAPATCPVNTTSCVSVKATFPYSSIILASFLPIASQFTLGAEHLEPQVGG